MNYKRAHLPRTSHSKVLRINFFVQRSKAQEGIEPTYVGTTVLRSFGSNVQRAKGLLNCGLESICPGMISGL
jgi:hypothetical protein